jgi:hypothetical protein
MVRGFYKSEHAKQGDRPMALKTRESSKNNRSQYRGSRLLNNLQQEQRQYGRKVQPSQGRNNIPKYVQVWVSQLTQEGERRIKPVNVWKPAQHDPNE